MDISRLDTYHLFDVVRSLGYRRRMYETMQAFKKYAPDYGLDTVERMAMFWSQMAHETGGFRWYKELGNAKYFKKYNGRKDLGNTEPGDGPRFKGRGIIHLTGRANYTHYSKLLGVDLVNNPELAEKPEIAVRVALEYWKNRNLNKYADKEDVKAVTRRINGGYNGLNDRKKYYNAFKTTLLKDFS